MIKIHKVRESGYRKEISLLTEITGTKEELRSLRGALRLASVSSITDNSLALWELAETLNSIFLEERSGLERQNN